MPFNGSGSFVRSFPAGGWAGDAAAGTKILATRHDTHDNDLASGLSNVICKDGQSSPTADIPFNAKKITNLGAPTTGTDAATKAYVDGIRTFSTAITLSGAVPNATIGFSVADIGFGARTAGTPVGTLNRFVWNDKPDLSGQDIAVLDDIGNLSIAGGTGNNLVYNGYNNGAGSWLALSTGYVGWLNFNKTTGLMSFLGTAASVTGGAAAATTGLASLDKVGNFATTGAVSAGSGVVQSLTANLVLATTGAGTVFLRPNGNGSVAGQAYIDTNGHVNIYGNVLAKGGQLQVMPYDGATSSYVTYFNFAGTPKAYAYYNPSNDSYNVALGTYTLTLNNTTGQLTTNGTFNTVAGQITGGTTALVLGPNSAGALYFRPNGVASTTGQTFVNSDGSINVAGSVVGQYGANPMYFGAGGSGRVFVWSSSFYFDFVNANGNLNYATTTSAAAIQLVATGGIILAGSLAQKTGGTAWTNPSDLRIKDVRGEYKHGLAELLKVNPVIYNYKAKPDDEYIGVVAQDIETILPECVSLTEGELEEGGEKVADLRIFDASAMTFALINAVKELSGKLDTAMARIAVLEGAPA